MLNRTVWNTVEQIYPAFKDRTFTVHDIAVHIKFQGRVTGHLLGAMPNRGIIERSPDTKRGSWPAYWQFTPKFKRWYETKYLPEVMANGGTTVLIEQQSA